jgi:hypothetical protein
MLTKGKQGKKITTFGIIVAHFLRLSRNYLNS